MKGHPETLKKPVEPQDKSSAVLEPANSDHAVVVQLEFPVDKMIALQRQSVPAPPTITPRGMPRTMAASYIGCSPRKFDYMVQQGEMPAPRLFGNKKVWDRVELDEFFEALPKPDEDGNDWDEC
ncbi:MAG: hypothetical protein OQK35_02065 [Alphaproteobacteria bacterium]|nr:hypothetical protein [Alphaproteobacteria bacterium]